jgi:hypothetical protein
LSHQKEVLRNEAIVSSFVSTTLVDVFAWFDSPGKVVNNIDVGDPFTQISSCNYINSTLLTCFQVSMWTQVKLHIHIQQQKV